MLSFIIPAYNEEDNISATIEKIRCYTPSKLNYEIIVVDHGSSDNTVEIAKNLKANVFLVQGGTIANLRNYGVDKSSGEIIIFIDSDISLTSQWKENIGFVLEKINSGHRLLTGSWYSVPENPNWIEKYWFKPLEKNNNTHINSGHMIISRKNFHELSGFNKNLETGEDYDISMRAKELGIEVVDNHDLKVIHEGYPKGLWEFILREYWHGKGDSSSLTAVIKSKVALLSLFFMLLHIVFILNLAFTFNLLVSYGCIFWLILICTSASYVKFKNERLHVMFINSLLYYFYFLSRMTSLISGVFIRKIKKRQR